MNRAARKKASVYDPAELRNFGLVTGLLFAAMFGIVVPFLHHRASPFWPWIVAAVLIGSALAYPTALAIPYRCWVRIGLILGWINSRVILTILFFGIFLPMGAIMRALGRDPVARRLDPDAASYRVPSRRRDKENMERPF